ncbi:MAG TPA: cellulase family glycosylhydrolase [Ignavibacteria bacterium]|mgnify:CR=1 FL=1|nr:cellulase family glycosylhydrolase [Ignavibacteria bacterium]
MKTTLILAIISIFAVNSFSNPKYDKWQDPSYFRGYNVLYESPKNLQDFIDFKNYGGNLFHIQPDGFYACDAPYDVVQANIDGCDMLVNYCRQVGIYYVIGMRSGPGAYDTFDESQGTTGESRVWNDGNTTEQTRYAEMLKMVAERYGEDTLFVGLNLVIEPRPKVRVIPANTSAAYKFFLENIYNIHMDRVYSSWVAVIRETEPDLPVILESFAYSTPELFPAYTVNDPYIIYSAHNYQPVEFSKEAVPFNKTYPGVYWNISTLSQVLYDAAFLRLTVFGKLRDFQVTTGAPVFIGEMGMYKPQNGGEQYLDDQLSIFKDYGWHFAFWDWRRGPGADWNIEKFGDPDNMHWKTVLAKFHAPPVPGMIAPLNDAMVSSAIVFSWDTMTAFTLFDLEISMINGSRLDVFVISDINQSTYTLAENTLQNGERYSWRIRSKNPGGEPENNSSWSEPRTFTVGSSSSEKHPIAGDKKNELSQNFPNPFNPSTRISYSLAVNSNVRLRIYDMTGREVASLVNDYMLNGVHSAEFNASQLASGVYIYKLDAVPADGSPAYTEIKKMILIK